MLNIFFVVTQPCILYSIKFFRDIRSCVRKTARTSVPSSIEVNFIMTVKDAVAKRFEQLCNQHGIRPNELATRAGVTPSTVYSMLDPSRQRVSIATIK